MRLQVREERAVPQAFDRERCRRNPVLTKQALQQHRSHPAAPPHTPLLDLSFHAIGLSPFRSPRPAGFRRHARDGLGAGGGSLAAPLPTVARREVVLVMLLGRGR